MIRTSLEYVKERYYLRQATWRRLEELLPGPLYRTLRVSLTPWDAEATLRFLLDPGLPIRRRQRVDWIRRFRAISAAVDCPHEEGEILAFVSALLRLPPELPGCIVEAGCYKGGSAAKFSIVAEHLGRELVLFDSFQGLPPVEEGHERSVFGRKVRFAAGDWCGTRPEVEATLQRFGEAGVCRLVEGWFDDTMPGFQDDVAALYIDVDYATSTRTCLQHLYPLVGQGGLVFAQDGHLPLVLEVYEDRAFWMEHFGEAPPVVQGMRRRTLIHFRKGTGGR